MYGLHLLLGTCETSLPALLLLQNPEVRIFTLLGLKYSHETQIVQHLLHYPKKGILE